MRALPCLGIAALTAVSGIGSTALLSSAAARTDRSAAAPAAYVVLDSVGFTPSETKTAYLVTKQAVSDPILRVTDSTGQQVMVQDAATDRGRWSSRYRHVYGFTFSSLSTPGTYRVHITGPVTAVSPTFHIEPPAALYGGVVSKGVTFFQNQRDGAHVAPGALHRQPSHLTDRRARIYATPRFPHPAGNDIIDGNLHRVGHSTVNVEGGWFDAGDYLKFTQTASYADVLLEASERVLGPAAPRSLGVEARYGERWLHRMWRPASATLLLQVGIGSGDRSRSYLGDHDLWRLPQADDRDHKPKDRFAALHRPVFRAAPPGHPISPNLAGRVAAAFALAAQLDATHHKERARRELSTATKIYRLADTSSPPHPLVSAEPFGYYPEDSWHDDMTLGGAEIALAKLDLHSRATEYLKQAAQWAAAYRGHDASSETFNLYDTSALADADLATAIARRHAHAGLAIGRAGLIADIRRQIEGAVRRSRHDPFGNGGFIDEFDIDSHTFGLIATAAMYDAVTHSHALSSFATRQRDWVFGANPWGASFMVGEGSNFPTCMQHQVANLSGSLDGSAPVDVGAVVNGPNDERLFRGGLGSLQEHVRRCPADRSDRYAPFTGHGSRYIDDERSWQTNEPAIDFTSTAILAGALQESLAG